MWQVAWGHPKFGNLLASASFDHRVIVWKEGPDGTWAQVQHLCICSTGYRVLHRKGMQPCKSNVRQPAGVGAAIH